MNKKSWLDGPMNLDEFCGHPPIPPIPPKTGLLIVLCFILMILVLGCDSAKAEAKTDEVTVMAGQWSRHWRPKPYYNEIHSLSGIEYKNWSVLHYTNSDYQSTNGIAHNWQWHASKHLQYGIVGMVLHGYDDINMEVLPMAAFYTRYYPFNSLIGIQINIVPSAVTSTGFTIRF